MTPPQLPISLYPGRYIFRSGSSRNRFGISWKQAKNEPLIWPTTRNVEKRATNSQEQPWEDSLERLLSDSSFYSNHELWMILNKTPWVMDDHEWYSIKHGESWIFFRQIWINCHIANCTSFTMEKSRAEDISTNFEILEAYTSSAYQNSKTQLCWLVTAKVRLINLKFVTNFWTYNAKSKNHFWKRDLEEKQKKSPSSRTNLTS